MINFLDKINYKMEANSDSEELTGSEEEGGEEEDSEDDGEEEIELENSKDGPCDADYDDGETDDWKDPYDGLSVKQLKERLPAYLFLHGKAKKKYFRDLNSSYFKEIVEKKDTDGSDQIKNVLVTNNVSIRSEFTFDKILNFFEVVLANFYRIQEEKGYK